MAAKEDFEMPVAKRQRIEEQPLTRSQGSRLFAPFRTVGLVSPTPVAFTSVPLGKTTFQITTSIGRSLQTYDLRRGLNLVFLSRPQCPEQITATCAYKDRIFTAWGNGRAAGARGVWVLKRGKFIGQLETESLHEQEIEQIIVFGAWIVGCGPRAIEVWRSDTYEHYTTILPLVHGMNQDERILTGRMCTLPTYLNKILVGRQDGKVELYNISTGKLVHTLETPSSTSGAVTAIAPAPSLSLVAIAYANGLIAIVDVETDETFLTLQQSNQKNFVTSITFRTDGSGAGEDGRQDGIMATASINSGDVTIWDLNRGGKVVGVLRGAHEILSSAQGSGINKIEFLAGQPVIVSSGLDNAIKSWIFDQNPYSPTPRLLHSRSGHAAPITNLRFLPAASDGSEAAGKWLLSAGRDRSLWGFSLRKDGQSTELSQGNVKSKAKKTGKLSNESSSVEDFKAPPVIAMACSLNRDGGMGGVSGPIWTNPKAGNAEEANMTGWESVVTAHDDDRFARTWFWGRKRAGRWTFESGDHKPVTAVAVSACGTFALVGSAGGSLDMFNLQSGIHRQRFPPKLKPGQAKQLKIQQAMSTEIIPIERGHQDGITGIIVDNLNQTVVSTSIDGTVIFWDFATGHIAHKMTFDSGSPTAIRYNPVSGLVSMACDDLCVRIVDIETKRVVRELWGCVGQIYDHCFSHDGRWIVACSMDSVVRVFDLATGHLVDAFKTATCTSVAFSSTGEFLATAHAGSIGINIWNNKSLFTHIPSRQIDEEKGGIIDLTTSSEFDAVSQVAIQQDFADGDSAAMSQKDTTTTIDQLDSALLTLSLVPQSRWQTLLNLETIRERNKPIQPPSKPKAAPFFLGTSSTNPINPTTEFPLLPKQTSTTTSSEDQSRLTRLTSLAPTSTTLTTHLDSYSLTNSPLPLISHLQSLPPSSTDLEIRTLTTTELPIFIDALTSRLQQRRDFELINTWMSVLLRVHGEFVSSIPEVRDAVVRFRDVMEGESKRLSDLVGWVRGVGDFLRSAR